MELYVIKNGLIEGHLKIEEFYKSLDIEAKQKELSRLTYLSMQEDFWDNPNLARTILDQLNEVKRIVDGLQELKNRIESIQETYDLLIEEDDQDLQEILAEDYQTYVTLLNAYEKETLLNNEFDHMNAIVEIHPGAGGTESQDWAEMMYRMYYRYCDKKGYKAEVLDYLDGDEAGIKSVTFRVIGYNAYGHFKSEKGVHRLVRISPFDSNKRRHTSFASVDVMPEINNDIEIEVRSEDLRIDTFRSSGAGGQHVNTTDSAVRITHVPTGVVASSQSQRSQIQNREQAMVMLKSKLYRLMIEEQVEKLNEIRGEQKEIAWGSQIRSYVFQPYTLVKDNRSGYQSSDVNSVMNGDLDDFVYAYLKFLVRKDDVQ